MKFNLASPKLTRRVKIPKRKKVEFYVEGWKKSQD